MLNSHDPSFSAVSLALHVTVVVPTGYTWKSPDITTLPRLSSHTMVVALMTPSTVSLAVGDGDHVTTAPAIPGSTVMFATLFGHKTAGGLLSA